MPLVCCVIARRHTESSFYPRGESDCVLTFPGYTSRIGRTYSLVCGLPNKAFFSLFLKWKGSPRPNTLSWDTFRCFLRLQFSSRVPARDSVCIPCARCHFDLRIWWVGMDKFQMLSQYSSLVICGSRSVRHGIAPLCRVTLLAWIIA